MKKAKDTYSNLILISILLIICILIFYLFFYPGLRSKTIQNEQPEKSTTQNAVEQFTPEETRYKGKNVYIIDPFAKIRVEPKTNATVLGEKAKGDSLVVDGALGDWFYVIFDAERKGWILREQVSDRKPSQKIQESIPVQTEKQDKIIAVDQVRAELDTTVAQLNQLAQQQFTQDMVSGFEILENGARLVMYIKEPWYYLPPFQKQATFNVIALQYGKLTCQYNIRPECNQNDFPSISFVNNKGKEVARIAANSPLQIYE